MFFTGTMYKVSKNLFFVTYAIGKDLLSYIPDKRNEFLRRIKKLLSVIFGMVLLTLLFILAIPFIAFHICLRIVLKLQHGEMYGGFLNGLDIIFEIKPKKTVMNVVMIFSCLDNSHVLIEKLKERAHQMHQSCYKFGSEIRTILGYHYFLKNRVSLEEVIDIARYDSNKYMTRENLLHYLETKCSTIAENQMWKAIFFAQPILWNIQREDKQLAVVLTFRHALGDLPSILSFIKKHFQLIEDTKVQNMKLNAYDVDLNLDNVCILWNPFTSSRNKCEEEWEECNNLNGLVATYIEEKAEYISKIKRIKEKLNVTFVEVFAAAISSSVYEYALERNMKIKNISMGTVVRPVKDDILEIVNGTYNFQDLSNRIGALIFNIPFNSKKRDLKNILLNIHDCNKTSENSMDAYMFFAASNYLGTYFPQRLTSVICEVLGDNVISGISNVVGLSRSTCCGNTIDDIFFYASDFLNAGFSCFIHSYAGRIQFAVVSKAGFVQNRQELQQILDNVFKNIDELSKDLNVM